MAFILLGNVLIFIKKMIIHTPIMILESLIYHNSID